MASQPPPPQDLLAFTRNQRESDPVHDPPPGLDLPISRRFVRFAGIAGVTLCILLVLALVAGRLWTRRAINEALPQLDGSLSVSGLHAPVSVLRDQHGVPSIRAASMDDLIFTQGFLTAGDRLFQMDSIRRHAAGELAEILGSSLLQHDRMQRTLQIRAAADRAIAQLPPEQLHWLEIYAAGVNAAVDAMHDHLPIEFRILNYRPKPWLPRDSVLVSLAMFEDLTNGFPEKLNREALTARLATDSPPDLRAQLLSDLFPVGSWRDHPPSQPVPDLTAPVDEIPPVPLDDSQVKLRRPGLAPRSTANDLLALTQALAPACPGCRAGSNNWVVSGAHTASGQPLLSNDMHLTLSVPGIWYAANLEAPLTGSADPFHVAGVTLPGTPFVIVGHNQHVAWGFTNLGADVQDLYLEHTRGSGVSQEFQTADGNWRPMLHQRELIHVRGAADQTLDVLATEHGSTPTPIISPMLPSETRPVSLRWVIYDPGTLTSPFFAIDSATDGPALARAFGAFAGPAQNLVYADDHGHIGYHATGRIPWRGSSPTPTAISPVPTDATAPDASTHEWTRSIPYDQLPQTVDPPGGILATANARVTPDAFPFPITDNWGDPYRNQRIWKLLAGREHLSPSDMLAIQGDVYSDPDRVIAQRLAYAIDHASLRTDAKRLHQAADLLRSWNGKVSSTSAPAAIVDAARAALWPMILTPKLPASAPGSKSSGPGPKPWQLYLWGERAFAEEQIIVHAPTRWLPPGYATWDDLLAAAVDEGLIAAHVPANLSTWRFGKAHPLAIQHPLFAQSALLSRIVGLPTGVTSQAQSGNGTTIKQVGRSFGPSERFTADLANLDGSTLNLVLGESGNPASPWFLDQFPAWLHVTTFPLPFTDEAVQSATTHSLTLNPR